MKKTITAILALAFACIAGHCASVTLAWDPNPEPDIAGYRIWWRTNGVSYTTNQTVTVTNGTTGTVTNLSLGRQYFFVATAFSTSGLESDYSNEVTAIIPRQPQPPTGLRTNQIILKTSLLRSTSLDGQWAVVHSYDDLVVELEGVQAFYKPDVAIARIYDE